MKISPKRIFDFGENKERKKLRLRAGFIFKIGDADFDNKVTETAIDFALA